MISKLCSVSLYLFLFVSFPVCSQTSDPIRTEKHFDAVKNHPQQLRAFLRAMPKGGDLHNHMAGASYAENLLRYAEADNFCVDKTTYVVSHDPSCPTDKLLNTSVKNPQFYNSLIDAWSMRNFHEGQESGHDHFFAGFGKFDPVCQAHQGEMLAEIAQRAGVQNESYLELMITADNNESGQLGSKVGWNADLPALRLRLLSQGLPEVVTRISTALTKAESTRDTLLHCGSVDSRAGCGVKVRYLYQVLREQPPEMVFAQLLAGFEAADKDPRVLGLNMVQAEDGPLSMRDYKLQMRMLQYLHQQYPKVALSLHAGELNASLVSAEGLKSHIHDAVFVAGARRIGHGVDITTEENRDAVLKTMAEQGILVEVNLSSNASILHVNGSNHPLPLYLRSGVPVALSTDDEGMSRSNLTKEFELAVNSFQLSYPTLKTFVRNSLTHAFLPGKNLWADAAYKKMASACAGDVPDAENLSAGCQAYLHDSEKAALQWDLEKRFTRFEKGIKSRAG